jgi:hypothetical protein
VLDHHLCSVIPCIFNVGLSSILFSKTSSFSAFLGFVAFVNAGIEGGELLPVLMRDIRSGELGGVKKVTFELTVAPAVRGLIELLVGLPESELAG